MSVLSSMSPLPIIEAIGFNALDKRKAVPKPTNPYGLILEAWSLGYLIGAIVIMICVTMVNMRRGILLHKLIVLELVLCIGRGLWLFVDNPVSSWWLSVSSTFMYMSFSLHSVIAWMKVRPFLSRRVSQGFICSVILAQAYWIVEIYANFNYFQGFDNHIFPKTRPFEALFRDPWWIYANIVLLWKVKTLYRLTLKEIIRINPRFGIILLAAILGIICLILDILSTLNVVKIGITGSINPFWKLAAVFKCLSDCILLDDFKTIMDKIRTFAMSRFGSTPQDAVGRARDSSSLGHI